MIIVLAVSFGLFTLKFTNFTEGLIVITILYILISHKTMFLSKLEFIHMNPKKGTLLPFKKDVTFIVISHLKKMNML